MTLHRQRVVLFLADRNGGRAPITATMDLPPYATSLDFAVGLAFRTRLQGFVAETGESSDPARDPKTSEALTLGKGFVITGVSVKKKVGDEWLDSGPEDLQLHLETSPGDAAAVRVLGLASRLAAHCSAILEAPGRDAMTTHRQRVVLFLTDLHGGRAPIVTTADLPAFSTSRDFAALLAWVAEQKGYVASAGESADPARDPRACEEIRLGNGFVITSASVKKRVEDDWQDGGPKDLQLYLAAAAAGAPQPSAVKD